MKTENSMIMKQARDALKGKWGLTIGTFVVYFLISMAVGSIPKVGPLISCLIAGPLTLGMAIFSLSLSRNQNPKLDQIFLGFKRFGTSLAAYLLIILFVILWSLLLIVPGIIASLSYSMTFFILVDDSSVGARDAIRKSKKMMYGNKWKFFCLELRFLGWVILAMLTLGIGFLWLVPYVKISMAKFYDDIKNHDNDVVKIVV